MRRTLIGTLLVLAATTGLVLTAEAGATVGSPVEASVVVTGINASCANLTTPTDVYDGAFSFDLYVPGRWSSKVDGGVMTTTLSAAGLDAAGRSFSVSAMFRLDGYRLDSTWFFPGGQYGSGTVKVTREDGAKLIASGSFSFSGRTLGFPWISLGPGTCAGTKA